MGLSRVLWLLPLVAMQLTDKVEWTGVDFAFAAAMFTVLGLRLELISRLSRPIRTRFVLSAGAVVAFVFVWGALATA